MKHKYFVAYDKEELIKMEKIAKSSGLELITHSKIINKYALILFDKIAVDNDFKEKYSDIISYSSLFHDIGKLTTNFQKFLSGKKKTPGYKFRHNEIGWAFLSKYLSEDFINYESREIILNIVYWHHGISNKLQKHTDTEILSEIDEESIKNMTEYLIECVGESQVIENIDNTPNKSPLYFPEDKILKRNLHNLNLLRSIVVTADRNGSNYNDINQITENLIINYLNMSYKILIGDCKFDGTPRYKLQKSIVDEIKEGKTTIVKAPAGFGKTLIGVLWGFKNNKKVIWVVPRNTIAKSLYKSILEELSNLNISTSVQLILSGEVAETNDSELDMYQSNIIITNVDNYLSPNIKNNLMDSSGLLFGANVIFDEYHELITDAPMMALFINIMKARNLSTKSSTLLLSATPINCNHLWELGKLNKTKETIILPNEETHYPAAHDKKYLIKVHNKLITPKPNTNTLNIINTVGGSQAEKSSGDYTLLLHSNFTEEYKNEALNRLLSEYGKKSQIISTKPNVIGTHILQASFDISFSALYENVLSPQSTLQRIGRVNRWGELDSGIINIVKDFDNETNKGDKVIKNILYNRNLSDRWFDYISKYNEQELTLNELYVIYNSYNNEANDAISDYVNNVYNTSLTYLSTLYPYKFENTPNTSKLRMTAGSNKLRSVNNEIFFIVKHQSKDEWIGPFTKVIHNSYDIEFNEEGNTYNRMIKTMKKLRDDNDDRFSYNDILDSKKYGGTIDRVRNAAKKSDTPYIVYDRLYNDELGIIKIN